MHITRLQLENFRCFKSLEANLNEKVTVFVGENASGKTSLLLAIAVALSRLFASCAYGRTMKGTDFDKKYVTQWSELVNDRDKTCHADASSVVCNVSYLSGQHTLCARLKKAPGNNKYRNNVSREEAQETKALANLFNQLVEEQAPIPAFAFYGPFRGAEQGGRVRFGRKKVDLSNPFSAYDRAFEPSIDFDTFLDWFSKEEHNEYMARRDDPCFKSKELEAVRRALERFLSSRNLAYEDPHFIPYPKRFVVREKIRGKKGSLRLFDNLSDGYRSAIALVGDFARKLAITHRYSSANPLDGDGILIIDEIDVHLHPSWQYHIIEDLKRTFPNVQLILTTHSPQVLSTLRREEIRVLGSLEACGIPEANPYSQPSSFALERIMDTLGTPKIPEKDDIARLEMMYRAGLSEEADALRYELMQKGVEIPNDRVDLWKFLATRNKAHAHD